ncbi:hypothetical protein KAX21_02435 [candidate division WOR-3 bacterium]|nr:hypothetical protein [candidate division WOR-3 bacterium]
MFNLLLASLLFCVGFEAGGGAAYEKAFGEDLQDFEPTLSWGAEAGVRDVLPGIGFDLGMRRFGVEKESRENSLEQLLRWEGYFFDATAVFESWPYLKGPLGIRFRVGGSYVPWRMLAAGEVIPVICKDTLADTLYMEANDWGVILGGSVMFRPISFLIIDAGVNHRHIFSMNTEDYGEDDSDERFLEVYLGARFRF